MTKEEQVLKSILEDLKSDFQWAEKKADEESAKKTEQSNKMFMFFHGIKVHSNTMIERINEKLQSYEN